MDLHQHHLDSVVFLCTKTGSGHEPFATAFLIALNEEPRGDGVPPWYYLATARHCIEEIPSSEIFVRINAQDGTLIHERTQKKDWFCHDDADVAAIPSTSPVLAAIPSEAFVLDYKASAPPELPKDHILRKYAERGHFKVKVGDDLFFTGLFVQTAGKRMNLPIARFGHISRMPVERVVIPTSSRGDVHLLVYLAECHSWGGHSGSPSFWYKEFTYSDEILVSGKKKNVVVGKDYLINFMGLVTGHYNIPEFGKGLPPGITVETNLNAGIALITPADKIRELLMRTDVKAEREVRFKQGLTN